VEMNDDETVATLSFEVRLGDNCAPPSQVVLFEPDAKGVVRTTKGDLLFDAKAAAAVMAKARDYANDYAFDFGHSMVAPAPGADPAESERAAGWYRLKLDGQNLVTDGLTWTKRAAKMLSRREIRYISPAVRYDPKTRRVTEWINAALVGTPATKGLRPLVASRTADAESMENFMAGKLGLDPAATMDEIKAELERRRTHLTKERRKMKKAKKLERVTDDEAKICATIGITQEQLLAARASSASDASTWTFKAGGSTPDAVTLKGLGKKLGLSKKERKRLKKMRRDDAFAKVAQSMGVSVDALVATAAAAPRDRS
jgi:hypothetical protein